jgi:hypothetical protein
MFCGPREKTGAKAGQGRVIFGASSTAWRRQRLGYTESRGGADETMPACESVAAHLSAPKEKADAKVGHGRSLLLPTSPGLPARGYLGHQARRAKYVQVNRMVLELNVALLQGYWSGFRDR